MPPEKKKPTQVLWGHHFFAMRRVMIRRIERLEAKVDHLYQALVRDGNPPELLTRERDNPFRLQEGPTEDDAVVAEFEEAQETECADGEVGS